IRDFHVTGVQDVCSSDLELKRLVNILLQEIENWPNQGLLVAATNHPELVDPALWRRFDLDVTFYLPSEENVRKAVIEFLGVDYRSEERRVGKEGRSRLLL